MIIRVCPKCDKAFFSVLTSKVRCSHCGFVLYDRREAQRVRGEATFGFKLHGIMLEAKLKDFSEGGLRAEYKGNEFDVNTCFDVDIKEFGIKGRIKTVWSRKLYGSLCESGFKFVSKKGART